MIKKLLFLLLLTISTYSFSQERSMKKLVASPNPFSNTTTISFNSSNKKAVVLTVRNVLGKTVFSKKINATKGKNSIQFMRNNLKSGMYIYAIQSTDEIISKRFVIR